MRKTVKSSLTKRIAAMLLMVMMVLSTTVNAFAVDGGMLSGEDPGITLSDGTTLISESVPEDTPSDSDSLDSILDNIPNTQDTEKPSLEEEGDNSSFEENTTEQPSSDDSAEGQDENWLQSYVDAVLAYMQASSSTSSPARVGMMRAAASASPDLSFIAWSGDDLKMGSGSDPAHMSGSPGMPRNSLNGEVAFCGQWNGVAPGGSYTPTGEGSDNTIKQILGNYDNSSKSDADYAAAQVAIWAHQLSTSNISWGGCPGSSSWDEIANGSCDYSDLKYNYTKWGGGTQNLITYHMDTPPDDPFLGDDDDDDDDTNARGQVTIIKKDDEGRALDGAIFNIEVVFSDGSRGGNSAFEVTDGSATFYYNHPKDNKDPATVTVTEIQAPPGYVVDPTPKMVTVSPTYAKSSGGGGGEGGEGGGGGEATLIVGDAYEATFINPEAECTLVIYKYQKGDASIPLAGAQFDIEYVDKNISAEVFRRTTGADSKITLTLEKAGTLMVTETEAPANYKIIETENRKTVVLRRGETQEIDIPNDKHGTLRIYKKDIDDHRPLAGAVFEVLKIGDDGKPLGEIAGYHKTVVTAGDEGVAIVEGLEPGSYQITEKSPPPFYSLSDDPIQTVTVLDGSQKMLGNKKRGPPEKEKSPPHYWCYKLPKATAWIARRVSSLRGAKPAKSSSQITASTPHRWQTEYGLPPGAQNSFSSSISPLGKILKQW